MMRGLVILSLFAVVFAQLKQLGVNAPCKTCLDPNNPGTFLTCACASPLECRQDLTDPQRTLKCLPQLCDKPMRLAIVLDSSSSIPLADWNKQVMFARQLIGTFNLASDATQISLTIFNTDVTSTKTTLTSKGALTSFLTKFKKATSGVRYTNTAEALEVAAKTLGVDVSSRKDMGKDDVSRFILLLSDGGCTLQPKRGGPVDCSAAAIAKANQIRTIANPLGGKKPLSIFTVAVGDDVDLGELKGIANKPSDKYQFDSSDFTQLQTKLAGISKTICARVPPPPPKPAPVVIKKCSGKGWVEDKCTPSSKPCCPGLACAQSHDGAESVCMPHTCQSSTNMLFSMDFSGSVRDSDFQDAKKLVAGILDSFNFGSAGAAAGVQYFSNGVQTVKGVGQTSTFTIQGANLIAAVKKLKTATTGGTNAAKAFTQAAQEFAKWKKTGSDTFIILTDGDLSGANAAAKALRNAQVTVILLLYTAQQKIPTSFTEYDYAYTMGSGHFLTRINQIQFDACISGKRKVIDPRGPSVKIPDSKKCLKWTYQCKPGSSHGCCSGLACKENPVRKALDKSGRAVFQCLIAQPCFKNVNVILMLDVSGSITPAGAKTLKQVSSGLLLSFGYGHTGVKVGLMQFASTAKMLTNGLVDNLADAAAALSKISAPGGLTYMGKAFTLANSQLKSGEENFIIMLTDGKATNPTAAETAAATARGSPKKATIYTIGIGSDADVDYSALRGYTGNKPGQSFKATNFKQLSQELFKVGNSICKKGKVGTKPIPTMPTATVTITLPPTPKPCTIWGDQCSSSLACCGALLCRGSALGASHMCLPAPRYGMRDIVIIVDASQSVAQKEFQQMKDLVTRFISGLVWGSSGARVAIGIFGSGFYYPVHTGLTNDPKWLNTWVTSTKFSTIGYRPNPGSTRSPNRTPRYGRALQWAGSVFSRNPRPGVERFVLFFSDFAYFDQTKYALQWKQLWAVATFLQASNINIYPIVVDETGLGASGVKKYQAANNCIFKIAANNRFKQLQTWMYIPNDKIGNARSAARYLYRMWRFTGVNLRIFSFRSLYNYPKSLFVKSGKTWTSPTIVGALTKLVAKIPQVYQGWGTKYYSTVMDFEVAKKNVLELTVTFAWKTIKVGTAWKSKLVSISLGLPNAYDWSPAARHASGATRVWTYVWHAKDTKTALQWAVEKLLARILPGDLLTILKLKTSTLCTEQWGFRCTQDKSTKKYAIISFGYNGARPLRGHGKLHGALPDLASKNIKDNGGHVFEEKFALMRRLVLVNNEIEGTFPVGIGNLGKGANSIWKRIFKLKKYVGLEVLSLANNLMYGSFPWTVLNNNGDKTRRTYTFFDISSNNFTGSLVTYDSKGKQIVVSPPDTLRSFYIENNQFTGTFPGVKEGWLFTTSSKLQYCRCERNPWYCYDENAYKPCAASMTWTVNVNGKLHTKNVPICAKEGTSLKYSKGLFGLGAVAGIIWQPPKVRKLNGNALCGPTRVEPIRGVECGQVNGKWCITHINLESLNLVGEIPDEIGELTCLKTLSLNNNKIDGKWPKTISKCTSLEEIDVRNNKMKGPIPNSFGSFKNLISLDLGSNRFGGDLPKSLGTGQNNILLVKVDGNSGLSGKFPSGLTQAKFPTDKSDCDFSGTKIQVPCSMKGKCKGPGLGQRCNGK